MSIKTLVNKLRAVEGVDSKVLEGILSEADKLEAAALTAKTSATNSTQKVEALETAIASIAKAAGLDESAEPSEVATKTKGIVDGYATLSEEKQTLSTKLAEVEGKATKLERSAQMAQFAEVGGIKRPVLERLLSDRFDELKIEDNALFLGDKPIKEAVEADTELAPFKAALFVEPAKEPSPNPLPTGGPGGDEKKQSLVRSTLSKKYEIAA